MSKVWYLMPEMRKKVKWTIQGCEGDFQQFKVLASSSKIRELAFSKHSFGKFWFLSSRSFNCIKIKWKIHISETDNFSVYFFDFQTEWSVKNPQFWSDEADILASKPTHKIIVFTKFHKDRIKIVDLLLIANSYACALFPYPPSI